MLELTRDFLDALQSQIEAGRDVELAATLGELLGELGEPRRSPRAALERNGDLLVHIGVALEQPAWRPALAPKVVEGACATLWNMVHYARQLVDQQQVEGSER